MASRSAPSVRVGECIGGAGILLGGIPLGYRLLVRQKFLGILAGRFRPWPSLPFVKKSTGEFVIERLRDQS